VSAASLACAAPLTTNDAPGQRLERRAAIAIVVVVVGPGGAPRKVRIESCIANDLSERIPSSLRDAVNTLGSIGQRKRVGAGQNLLGIGRQVEGGELCGRLRRDTHPRRDKTVAALDAAGGEGIGVELRPEAVDAGNG